MAFENYLAAIQGSSIINTKDQEAYFVKKLKLNVLHKKTFLPQITQGSTIVQHVSITFTLML